MLALHKPGAERSVNTGTNDSYLLHQESIWLWRPVAVMDLTLTMSQAVVFHILMKSSKVVFFLPGNDRYGHEACWAIKNQDKPFTDKKCYSFPLVCMRVRVRFPCPQCG